MSSGGESGVFQDAPVLRSRVIKEYNLEARLNILQKPAQAHVEDREGVSEGGLDIDGGGLDRRSQGYWQRATHNAHRRLAPAGRAAEPWKRRLRRCPNVPVYSQLSSCCQRGDSSPLAAATSSALKRLLLSLFIHISFVCPSSFPCCSVPHFGTLSPLASLVLYWFAYPTLLCSALLALSGRSLLSAARVCLSISAIAFLPFSFS